MKTEEYNRQQSERLAKYLGGEMTDDERKSFEMETADSEENREMMEKLKKQWASLAGYKELESPDAGKAWRKLHSLLEAEKLIPPVIISSRKSAFRQLLRIAALLLVLVSIGVAIYVNISHKQVPEMVSINTSNESNTLIKTLTDGSVIYLAQNSSFSFPKDFEAESRNVELKGEAFFDITPNSQKPFIIETDEALIQVLGTAFNVKTKDETGFELFVDRGKVKVTLKANPSGSKFVVAGEKITTDKNNLVKSKYQGNGTSAWYRQRMHFKDETLQNIINVLNRNFNTTFVVAEKEIGNRRLTVTFQNETAETMTELLCITLNLKCKSVNGSVVLSENESTKHN